MGVSVTQAGAEFSVRVDLWLLGAPETAESHAVTADSVEACIAAIGASVAAAVPDETTRLLRGPATAELVQRSLRRALIEESAAIPAFGAAPIRVLLIDPNEPVRNLTQLTLSNAGFEVEAVSDETAAGLLCRRKQFDVVIVDLAGVPARDAATRVRAACGGARPLLVSEQVPEDTLVGPTGFLQKPFAKDQLVKAIRGLMG